MNDVHKITLRKDNTFSEMVFLEQVEMGVITKYPFQF